MLQERYSFRNDLIISAATERGRSGVVVKDEKNDRFFSLSDGALRFLRAFDGQTTVEEIITRFAGGDEARREKYQEVLAVARRRELLEGTDQLPVDRFEQVSAEIGRFNPFSASLGVIDPRRVQPALRWVGRVIFSPPAVVLWLATLITAVMGVVSARERLIPSFAAFTELRWLGVTYVVLFFSLILHELGHAAACARYGGRVGKIGFMLYLFRPGMYVDVSDAWLFPRARHRIVVSLAGVYVDSLVVCAALFTWRWGDPGSGVTKFAFVLATVSLLRVLFNLVPFLRLDGYFVLADLLGIKNLRPRAFALLLSLLPIVGRPWRRVMPSRQRFLLLGYGVISLAVVFIMLSTAITALWYWLRVASPGFARPVVIGLCLLLLGITVFNVRDKLWQYRSGSSPLGKKGTGR
jgi:putative peptide zinc metalloprotease protein